MFRSTLCVFGSSEVKSYIQHAGLQLALMYQATATESMSVQWVLLGMAARVIYQVGAHRLAAYRDTPNLLDQLWKRTFW